MKEIFELIYSTFEKNVKSVFNLVQFDDVILELSISHIDSLNQRLKQSGVQNRRLLAETTLAQLRSIRQNQSLRPKYETMYNQCIVLLVSYFGSGIKNLFTSAVTKYVMKGHDICNKDSEIKIALSELQQFNYEVRDNIGEIIVNNKNISFQDMQSICRAFQEWFKITIDRDIVCNNVTMSQACRHVIVHSGNVVERKFINQVKHLNPRTIKNNIKEGDMLIFSPKEIQQIGDDMLKFYANIGEQIQSVFRIS